MFLRVVKCQGIWADAWSKVRNSGGQVPYIWTSVWGSGLQCWGKMPKGSPLSVARMTHTWPREVQWMILNRRKRSCDEYYGWISAISFLIVTAIFYSMLSLFRTLDFLPPMHHFSTYIKSIFFVYLIRKKIISKLFVVANAFTSF